MIRLGQIDSVVVAARRRYGTMHAASRLFVQFKCLIVWEILSWLRKVEM
jgi:hypothetical protein